MASEYDASATLLCRYDISEICRACMLSIVFGDVENAVCHPPTYFDNTYLDEWITDSRTQEMVRDVDKS